MPKTNVNGIEKFYEVQGDGAPVVLVGGLSQDHLAWAFQVPALVAAGYRCIAPDNRDAGQTSESPSPYGIRQMADDTVGLMDALAIPSAHVIGLSMGGMIAQEMAINYPKRVASLTLVSTSAAADSVGLSIIQTWRAARPHFNYVDFFLMLSSWLFTHRFFQQTETVLGLLQFISANPFPQSADKFQRQCDAILAHDARDRLSLISAPTQIIVGLEDNLTPPRYSRWLAQQIAGTKLTEIPNAAHLLSIETPAALNDALVQFLDTHVGRQPAAA